MNRISLDENPGADLPLSPGVVSGNLVFVSGQVPRRADGTWITGSIKEQVDCTLDNVEAILVRAGSSMARLCRVNVYLTHRDDSVLAVIGCHRPRERCWRTKVNLSGRPRTPADGFEDRGPGVHGCALASAHVRA